MAFRTVNHFIHTEQGLMIFSEIFEYHCVKSVRIRSFSGPHFSAFGLNTKRYSESLRIQSKCGKMRTRITPNTDTFYAVYRFLSAITTKSICEKCFTFPRFVDLKIQKTCFLVSGFFKPIFWQKLTLCQKLCKNFFVIGLTLNLWWASTNIKQLFMN